MTSKPRGLIQRDGTVLVVIDVQERLFPHIHDKETVSLNIRRLVRFASIIGMPIIVTEQYPKGLGRTIPEIRGLIQNLRPIEKLDFNCFGSREFREALEELKAENLILTGIEAHICVSQTAIDGVERGYRVYIVADATSSRREVDKLIALERARQYGAVIVSTEMLIYELLRRAGTKEFKEALKLVKR